MKLVIGKQIFTIISLYAPQKHCPEIEKERFEQAVNSGMVTSKTSSKDGCVRWHNSTSASNLMICKVPEGEDDLEYLMKYLSESDKDDHKSLVLDIRNRYA